MKYEYSKGHLDAVTGCIHQIFLKDFLGSDNEENLYTLQWLKKYNPMYQTDTSKSFQYRKNKSTCNFQKQKIVNLKGFEDVIGKVLKIVKSKKSNNM